MKEKRRDLNMLRDAMARRREAREVSSETTEPTLPAELAAPTTLPEEESQASFVDINGIRKLSVGEISHDLDTRMPQELTIARDKFESAGLTCETFFRGDGLEPWIKVMLPGRDVYVAYQYNRIVATDRIDGFPTSTAGLGEFEYYVEV